MKMSTTRLKAWFLSVPLVLQVLAVGICSADEIIIPYSVKTEAFQKRMKKIGFDLYGKERSIGFVKDEGGKMTVYTYRTASPKLLDEIQRQASFTARN